MREIRTDPIKPEISVVIPNLNGMKYLHECLSSLQNQTFRNYEVIVVDNGSHDGSADFIRKEFPQVKALHVERNRIWVAVKNFPLPWLLRAPYFTLKIMKHAIFFSPSSSPWFTICSRPSIFL